MASKDRYERKHNNNDRETKSTPLFTNLKIGRAPI
jgi:hypothetical protein